MNLVNLRTKTRRKLDELSESFWSDDELDDYINEAYFHYWQWMLRAEYYRCQKTALLDLVSGTPNIALPSDFAIAKRVERVLSSGSLIPLDWDDRYDEPNYANGGGTGNDYLPSVNYEGSNLILEPTPQESVTGGIKLTYYYYPERLEDDGDEPDAAFLDFYHDIIIGQAVLFAKAKEENIGQGGADLGSFGALQERKEQKFRETIEMPSVQRQSVQPYFT